MIMTMTAHTHLHTVTLTPTTAVGGRVASQEAATLVAAETPRPESGASTAQSAAAPHGVATVGALAVATSQTAAAQMDGWGC